MDNKKLGKSRGASFVFSKLFANSLTSDLLTRLRRGALSLRVRVIGVFLSTFGVYSLIASLITRFLTTNDADSNVIGFGICIVIASIPLMLCKDNVSVFITDSFFGSVVCDVLGIKPEAIISNKSIGRLNAGFAAGVAAGTLTLFFSPFDIIAALLIAAAAGIILTTPKAGPALSAAGILVFGKKLHCFIIAITILSFILKLARGKQDASLRRSDAPAAIFMLCVLCGFIFSRYDGISADIVWYLLMILTYFTVVFLYKSCRGITHLETVTCICAAVVSCVYIAEPLIGMALTSAAPASDALPAVISSLYAFRSGAAASVLAALIPLSVGTAMRRHSFVPRTSMWLCAAVMTLALIEIGNLPCLAAAAAATVIILLITGRKSVYVTLTVMLGAVVVFMYTDFGSSVLSRLFKRLLISASSAEGFWRKAEALEAGAIYGTGFGVTTDGGSLYYGIVEAIGFTGLILFAVCALTAALQLARLAGELKTLDVSARELQRFGTIRSADDTLIGAAAPFAACVALLICGAFTDIAANPISLMLLWSLGGMCVSYSRGALSEINKAREASRFLLSSDGAVIDIEAAPQRRRTL